MKIKIQVYHEAEILFEEIAVVELPDESHWRDTGIAIKDLAIYDKSCKLVITVV